MIKNNLEIKLKLNEMQNMKYWYGGKGEIATVALADRLKKENPSVWTSSYYNKAIKDIDGVTRVGDCSYLVCTCYDVNMIGSSQIKNKFSEYFNKQAPKDGMILWKKGHVGIYWDKYVWELRGIDYDFQNSRMYNANDWSAVLYSEGVDYDFFINNGCKLGWHDNIERLAHKERHYWYRFTEGTGEETYYHDGIFAIDGKEYPFDSEGYLYESYTTDTGLL